MNLLGEVSGHRVGDLKDFWGDFTDLSLLLGLNPTQSDSWLSFSLFVKLAPGHRVGDRIHFWHVKTYFV